MRLALRLGRVQQVPALDVTAFARQLGEARAAPQVGLDAPVLFQQFRSGDHLAEDGARTQQLHARPVAVLDALAELVHALDDVALHASRHFRMLVVLVHHRQVVVDVLLLGVHAAQAVLHDHGQFVLEGRIVGDAVRDGGMEHVRVAVLVLQAFAVQRGTARGAASRKPRERMSAAAQHRSPMRWMPNISSRCRRGSSARRASGTTWRRRSSRTWRRLR